jgi:hypothetical protein
MSVVPGEAWTHVPAQGISSFARNYHYSRWPFSAAPKGFMPGRETNSAAIYSMIFKTALPSQEGAPTKPSQSVYSRVIFLELFALVKGFY